MRGRDVAKPNAAGRDGGDKGKPDLAWGFIGLAASVIVAVSVALLFVLLSAADLGDPSQGLGAAYAGLAVIFVGVLIFLGGLLVFGLFLGIFFFAVGRKKALFVALGQIALAGVVMALFLAYIAN